MTLSKPNAHTDLNEVCRGAWAAGVPRQVVPICGGHGVCYCVMPSGEVCFWSHADASDERWQDIAHWIRDLWLEERAD